MPAFGPVIIILIAALVVSPSAARTVLEKVERNEIVRVPNDDPDMAAAKRKARATLREFLALAANPKPSMQGFALKVAIRHANGTEFIWVNPFERKGPAFIGRLANTPRDIPNLKFGQRIKFTESEIFDWMYRENGKMKGNFTACALLKRETRASADAFKKKFGLDCDFLK
jgi:uncharacterized protein YegJ (DUF2314 family)